MPLFDFKLKDIFKTVKEPVGKFATLKEADEFLLAKIRKEFGPLLDQLAGLPEKDGKKFSITIGAAQNAIQSEYGAAYSVNIAYKPVKSAFGEGDFFVQPVHGEAVPEMRLVLSMNNDVFGADVRQKYVPFHPEVTHFSHPFQKSTPFAKALKDVMAGLKAIAPDRIAEITAPASQAAKPQAMAI